MIFNKTTSDDSLLYTRNRSISA